MLVQFVFEVLGIASGRFVLGSGGARDLFNACSHVCMILNCSSVKPFLALRGSVVVLCTLVCEGNRRFVPVSGSTHSGLLGLS